ncbi:MAG: hypothetical protein Q4C91_12960 [Eubacteriales bacterium]|nr:hypothetical protein [Eubacteriales bacterium]
MGYDYFVALLTATKTEAEGLKRIYKNWSEKSFDNDSQLYYETWFEREGKKCKVVTANQNEMGMTASAVLTMKIIEHFRPRYLIMVGIAAGIATEEIEQQEYGDVIVPTIIWDYSAGKFVNAKQADIKYGKIGFIPRPAVFRMDADIEKCVQRAIESPKNECHAYMGPMACGTAVVANREILDKQILTQFSHTAGLDMESYAVVYAASNATSPRPVPIIVKSVSDFADDKKSDQYQKFAVYTSSEFAKLLYEEFLPMN